MPHQQLPGRQRDPGRGQQRIEALPQTVQIERPVLRVPLVHGSLIPVPDRLRQPRGHQVQIEPLHQRIRDRQQRFIRRQLRGNRFSGLPRRVLHRP
ncbi:MAG: hypothetical protein JXB13_14315 [Phycisphaerae bacterium]|nr:hypothetical protein [Phycisphaerae bacterium]